MAYHVARKSTINVMAVNGESISEKRIYRHDVSMAINGYQYQRCIEMALAAAKAGWRNGQPAWRISGGMAYS